MTLPTTASVCGPISYSGQEPPSNSRDVVLASPDQPIRVCRTNATAISLVAHEIHEGTLQHMKPAGPPAKKASWAAPNRAKMRIGLPLLVLCLTVLGQPCVGVPFVFHDTDSLEIGRYRHTATLLPNGKVLVAGGNGSDFKAAASAELYDPVTKNWTMTGSMGAPRADHTATLLPNGKVLVAGGSNATGILSSTELYDPSNGTWTATGSLGAAHTAHTATLLQDGKVLVAGGRGSDGMQVVDAELYDSTDGTWTATGGLGTARDSHKATLLADGRVLVVGGFGISYWLASAEIYDPTRGTWTGTGNLGHARHRHTATLLPNGKVLVAGGVGTNGALLTSAELYDPAGAAWAATGDLATPHYSHTATLLSDGTVFLTGGDHHTGRFFYPRSEIYDPASGLWSTATGYPHVHRLDHTATLLNGKVLVVGGNGGNQNLTAHASAELYEELTPLLNISTRLRVLTADKVLIAGFVITGVEPKTVLIRGIGPSLTGVGGPLPDPTLELHHGNEITTNDNWKINDLTQQSQEADISATTIPPTNDSESAILITLAPGAYTAILAGKDEGTGVGLVEVYDLAPATNSTLANISTRGFVNTGDNVMIGGLIVGGESGGLARLVVRALGPSIPVGDPLGDPTLELYDANGTLVDSNDNWKTRADGTSQQGEIQATTLAPTNDLESALSAWVAPGNYTAIVRGKNDTNGVGLLESYNLP